MSEKFRAGMTVRVTVPGEYFGVEGDIDRRWENSEWLVYLKDNSGDGKIFAEDELEVVNHEPLSGVAPTKDEPRKLLAKALSYIGLILHDPQCFSDDDIRRETRDFKTELEDVLGIGAGRFTRSTESPSGAASTEMSDEELYKLSQAFANSSDPDSHVEHGGLRRGYEAGYKAALESVRNATAGLNKMAEPESAKPEDLREILSRGFDLDQWFFENPENIKPPMLTRNRMPKIVWFKSDVDLLVKRIAELEADLKYMTEKFERNSIAAGTYCIEADELRKALELLEKGPEKTMSQPWSVWYSEHARKALDKTKRDGVDLKEQSGSYMSVDREAAWQKNLPLIRRIYASFKELVKKGTKHD